jgi:hypothetical protein
LVDGTNGQRNPQPPYQEEWDAYRAVVDEAGADASWLYDLPGSRDAWNDPGFSFYLANSVQGEASGQYRHAWTRSFSWGDYLIVGALTADEDGPPYPEEPVLLSDATADWLNSLEPDALDARMVFVFAHNPLADLFIWPGENKFFQWMVRNGAAAYGYGDRPNDEPADGQEYRAGLLRVNGGGLGFDGPCNYALWAVDHDGVSVVCAKAGEWPILITQPLDRSLGGGNERAYPLAAGAPSVHVRALAFAPEPPAALQGTIEGLGLDFDLPRIDAGPIYQGEFDATAVAAGDYQLTVSAEGLNSHTIGVSFGVTACFDGLDNDGDGKIDFPADDGCASYSDSQEIGALPPVADAGPDLQGAVGEPLFFNGLDSRDPDGQEPLEFRWTFGDEADPTRFATGAFVQHAYAAAGVFTARLIVVDTQMNRSVDTATVTVTPDDDDNDDAAGGEISNDLDDDEEADYHWGCGL